MLRERETAGTGALFKARNRPGGEAKKNFPALLHRSSLVQWWGDARAR